jgi:putative ABC transport system permease protein
VAEIAMALILMLGAGLLIKSFTRLVGAPLGFNPQSVITIDLKLPYGKYEQRLGRSRLYRQTLEKVAVIPGVESVSISNNRPGFTDGWQSDIYPEDHPPLKPGEIINVDWGIVTEDYFKTMGAQILSGRSFTKEEVDLGRPVVLVDENLARRFWSGKDALGKWIKYDSADKHEIIGVVKEVKQYGSEMQPLIKIYTPLGRAKALQTVLSIRTNLTDLQGLTAAVVQGVHTLDRDIPLDKVVTMEKLLAEAATPMRFNMALLVLFAAIAVALVVSGLYGVIAYIVAERTQEIGIRMTLGASQRDILKLIITHGLKLTITGIFIGIVISVVVTRLIKNLLFGVSTTDPVIFGVTCALLGVVALLACLLPTLKSTRIDPAITMRYE